MVLAFFIEFPSAQCSVMRGLLSEESHAGNILLVFVMLWQAKLSSNENINRMRFREVSLLARLLSFRFESGYFFLLDV